MPKPAVHTGVALGKSIVVMWPPRESAYPPTMSPRALTHAASVNDAPGTSTDVNPPSRRTKPCCFPSAVRYRPTISPDGVIAVACVLVDPGKSKDSKLAPCLVEKLPVGRHALF